MPCITIWPEGVLLSFCAAVFTACAYSGDETAPDPIAHPDSTFVARSSAPVTRVLLPDALQNDRRLPIPLLDPRFQLEPVDLGAPVGRIAEVNVNPVGRVHLLDDRLAQVLVLSPTGSLLEQLGRPGRADGEFFNPLAIAGDEADNLYVGSLDHSVQVFRLGVHGYEFSRRVALDFAPRSLCALNGSLVVSGLIPDTPHALTIYDSTGVRVATFAETYDSPNLGVNYQLRPGHVLCDAASNLIVFATRSPLFEVRAYRPTGEQVWALDVRGLQAIGIIERRRGDYELLVPDGGYHVLRSLSHVGHDGVLIQYELMGTEDRGGLNLEDVTSLFIEARTGEVRHVTRDFPAVSHSNGRLAITAQRNPRQEVPIVSFSEFSRW